MYAYRTSFDTHVAIVEKDGRIQEYGKDLPDYFTFWGVVRTNYADSWALITHPGHLLGSQCR